MGDIAVNKTLPAFPDGHITKWLTVIDQTAKVDAETIVPGHVQWVGRPSSRKPENCCKY